MGLKKGIHEELKNQDRKEKFMMSICFLPHGPSTCQVRLTFLHETNTNSTRQGSMEWDPGRHLHIKGLSEKERGNWRNTFVLGIYPLFWVNSWKSSNTHRFFFVPPFSFSLMELDFFISLKFNSCHLCLKCCYQYIFMW